MSGDMRVDLDAMRGGVSSLLTRRGVTGADGMDLLVVLGLRPDDALPVPGIQNEYVQRILREGVRSTTVPHDSGLVSHQADLAKQQTCWLPLHDRLTAGILGVFPLIAGMPIRFTETHDRDVRAFKHATATLVGWGLSPADVLRIEASDEPEVVLQERPSFLAARLTSPPSHLTDGIVLIRPTARSWTLRSLRVQRRGFHVAPDSAGTAHAYCGTTLAACKGDLLHWSATPTPDSRLRAYIIRSRVKAADNILLVQPYSPQLFRQPKAPGPILLLARQQGRVSHISRTKS